MKKRIVATVLCIGLIASLIGGCGKSSGNTEGDTAAPQEEVENTESAGGSGAGEVSFDLSMHIANVQEQEPAIYALVQEYMKKNPNVKINLTGEEANEHYNKMKMDAQAGTLPDVFLNLLAPSKEMAANGDLYCLDDFIKENDLSAIMNDNMLNSLNV